MTFRNGSLASSSCKSPTRKRSTVPGIGSGHEGALRRLHEVLLVADLNGHRDADSPAVAFVINRRAGIQCPLMRLATIRVTNFT